MVISEICCNFKELIYKQLQAKTSMITEDKVTEIFCMADDFCKFFDAMTAKYTLKPTGKTPDIDALIISSSTYYRQLPPISCFQRSRASMYKGPLTHSLHYSEFVELTLFTMC